MAEEVIGAVKLHIFKGEEDKFQLWWSRFKAYATVKRFHKGMVEQSDLPSTEE